MFILKTLLLTAMVTITRAGKVKDTEIDKTSSKCEFDCKASGHICCQLSNGIQECRKDENCPKLETFKVTPIVFEEDVTRPPLDDVDVKWTAEPTTMITNITLPSQGKTIAELVEETEELSTLLSFLPPELVDVLKKDGPFTVFAPSNDAFAKLPPDFLDKLKKPENIEELKKTLTRHVVLGKFESEKIQRGVTVVPTADDENITVLKSEGNKIKMISYAGSALVTKADNIASNGVVHIVDSVF